MPNRREEILNVLTLAVLDVLRAPDKKTSFFPSKSAVLRRANDNYEQIGGSLSALPEGIWSDVARRFRVVFDPADYKAEWVRKAFGIREIRVAPSVATIPDEAARLHVDQVDPHGTCFYSCGNTLAEMARRAASSGLFGPKFTACSSVVLATDAPSALPPSAITAEFQRAGSQVKTLSYLLPLSLQEKLEVDDNPDHRRAVRDAIERAVFDRAKEACFLWLGIGTITQPGSFHDHCAAIEAVDALEEADAVAEVGFMPLSRRDRLIYDELGLAKKAKNSEENWRRLAPPLRRFFNSTYVLKFPLPDSIDVAVVAGGQLKHPAIWHGLRFLSLPREETGVGEIAYFVTDVATIDDLYDRLLRDSRPISDRPSIATPLSLPPDTLVHLERLASARNCAVEAIIQDAVAPLLDQT